jgi:hypothetical protein
MKKYITLAFLSILNANPISPENGSVLNFIHVLFEWEQISEASYYELEVSDDINFSNIIFNKIDYTLCYIEKDYIEWNHDYFWRVRSINNSGQISDWSNTFNFSTTESLSNSSALIIDDLNIQPGVTVFGAFFNYFSAAIDQTGREIWNSGTDNFVYYSSNEYGNIFGCSLLSNAENNLPGKEISFEGFQIWNEPNEDFLHHDLIRLPNGNYLGIVETSTLGPIPIGEWTSLFQNLGFLANGVTPEFPWIGDKLVEWDKDTKEIVWSWNTFDHFSMTDFDQFGGTWNEAYFSLHYDWTHANAVIFDKEESALYLSSRHLSRITKIDYPSGEIVWNLGHQMNSDDIDYGSDIGFSFQHSLQILENGNLLTFDNGNLSEEFRGTEEPISRAIEIEIEGSSATVAWSYELSPELFGFASGNTQKLENGNVLITTVGGGGRSLEVNTSGDIIWEGLYNLSLPDGAVYRANRIPDIHPSAYSVIINNFLESNGNEGVYLSEENPELTITIHNESGYPLNLYARISDEAGWFSNEVMQFELEPYSSENMTMIASLSESINQNLIELEFNDVNHPQKSKVISTLGYMTPLTINNEIQPEDFSLLQAYPNPFNPQTIIKYQTFRDEKISLQIFDLNGKLMDTLIDKSHVRGNHQIIWVAKQYPSGIYFVKLTTRSATDTKKILFLK